jgi:hypothetical protein
MKQIFIKSVLMIALCMVFGTSAAQVYTEFNMTGKKPTGVKYTPIGMDLNKMDKHQYGHMNVYTPKQQFKSPQKAELGEVGVTFNLVYDHNVFMPPFDGVAIYNDDFSYRNQASWMGSDVVTVVVPPGTYDFAVHFISMYNDCLYLVIREQVEVTEDATFTLNAEEATNHISFVNYGPRGNVLKHALFGGYDEETEEPIILEEGDIDMTYVSNSLYLKGGGCVSSNLNYTDGPMPEEYCTAPLNEYYVNDVSDRYVLTQSRICANGLEEWYLSYFSTDDVHVGAVENNPEDYCLYHEDYQFTPNHEDENGYGVASYVYEIHNGYFGTTQGINRSLVMPKQKDTYSIDIYSSIPFEDSNYEGLKLLAGTEFTDNLGVVSSPWEEHDHYEVIGKTIVSPFAFENGQQMFYNPGHFDVFGPCGKNAAYAENAIRYPALSAPSAFNYAAEQRLGIIGDNCPINAVNVMSYFNEYEGDVMNFKNNFVGRYGESRIYDNADLTQTLKFNGVEMEDPNYIPRDGNGIWEFTVTNKNIAVDGLPGENKTKIYYDDTNEDSACPGIEMLQFRSDAGITDRFATAAEGTMEFMGADYKFTYDPRYWVGVYDCQPMNVTVEYSPYGEENWKELPIENVSELYQDGWGYFYRASLANVTGKAIQGWFDLRFKLRNEAGNWQEQVVSPAFRIEDQIVSAIEEVKAAADASEVARYTIDGRAISAPQAGVNIVKMSDGTVKKVFVK